MTDLELLNILYDFLIMDDPLKKADIIIGFGSMDLHTPVIVSKLFLEGWAPYILFSGGVGKITKNYFYKSEAEIYRDIAIKNGVPKSKIIIENQSTNSGENFTFSKQILSECGLNIKDAIIVHKPNIQRRVYTALKKQWTEINPIIPSWNMNLDEYLKISVRPDRSLHHIFCNMVGDLQRLWKHADSGFQIPANIPENVISAYNELVKRGYDKQLII
ncbi:MAG: YdcF family protein [Rickettsiales bacterium]|jgi:uncharacterized SAM-binding protein YcdF (DUF218 family)|nr:YdcF family protein [Rickettsiales bacterium]